VRRHGLSILQSAAGLEIGGYARRPEHVTPDFYPHAELGGVALDHAPGVDAVHRFLRQRAGPAGGGAEEGRLAGVADAGRLYICAET
jgi:hypothetical protein